MKTRKELALLALTVGASATLVACGSESGTDTPAPTTDDKPVTAVIVTDVGGVDDKSFNQGAWEGLTEWGKENGLEKGAEGYNYLQSNSDSDFIPNLNLAINSNYDMIFGVGYKLKDAIEEVAKNNPDAHFAIIDDSVELPNVASVTFKDHEASFLAGVAAAETTKTNKVGFIGGQHGVVIDRFEAGFVAGVKAVNPDIQVDVQYADSFSDAAKGKALADAMYANDVDVIFQAAGNAGTGVFTAAKEIVQADPAKNVWVVGVDRDQTEEGKVSDDRNVTLISTLKGVGTAVKNLSNDAVKGEFNGGKQLYLGLKEDGVGVSEGQISDEAKAKIKEFKEKIIAGEEVVPDKPAE
ncbi:nucleoside-binding protein [Granulicatella balaenopterae]|uniref:Nucleoside-binding protein n=1 Tax=Granulicatella balaenopterae TaxID=137733 RepID=A0A1H9PP18_9LACT|nr:BMP family protein [Granulicatella balaenopterae]SER50076.1 nucleoside-binding protein [Granulicatella balaenopterae]